MLWCKLKFNSVALLHELYNSSALQIAWNCTIFHMNKVPISGAKSACIHYVSFQSLTLFRGARMGKSSIENICDFANYMEIFGLWLAAEWVKFAVENEHGSKLTVKWLKEEGISHKTRRFTSTAFIFPPYLIVHPEMTTISAEKNRFSYQHVECVCASLPKSRKILSTNWNRDDTFECDAKLIENKSSWDEIQFLNGNAIICACDNLKTDIWVKKSLKIF